MSTLQDQLLKAGLVDQKQVKKANKAKRKQEKVQRRSRQEQEDEVKVQVQKNKSEKVERDKQLNLQQQAEAERKAIAAQIKQIIEMNRQPKGDGEVAYNFTDNKKIKKIRVSESISQQLARGILAIVRLDDNYELIPKAVAAKISERDESCIVVYHQSTTDDADEEDPYADYQIPDDLMW